MIEFLSVSYKNTNSNLERSPDIKFTFAILEASLGLHVYCTPFTRTFYTCICKNKRKDIDEFFCITELLGDILDQKPSETDGVESVIVIDGVPEVESERFEKLQSVIHKIYGKYGTIVNTCIPQNASGFTKG